MRYVLRICLFLISFSVFSQQRLTLYEAVNIALKNNFDIQLARNNVAIATINNNIGIAGGLPSVTGAASDQEQVQNIKQIYQNPILPPIVKDNVTGNTLAMGVNGNLLLFNGMRVMATKGRLEMLQNQNMEFLNLQIQNTIAQVMTNYFDIVRQKSYKKTIAKSISASETALNIVENQQKIGLSNNSNLFQAQVDLNSLKQSLIGQEMVINQAETELTRLLNVPISNAYEISDSIVIDKSLKIDSILTFLEKNPEIVAAGIQVKINEQIVKETAAQRYPSLRLLGGYTYNRTQSSGGQFLTNQSYGPYVGGSLNVPIYNGDIYKRQQQISKINTTSADMQRQSLERTYQSNAIKMWQAYKAALQQLETGIENYKIAFKLLDLVVQKFELHQATIVDVKVAQESFENAGYLVINLSYSAKAAEIELKRISNKLTF